MAKYYLAFTVVLILAFGGVYLLWNTYYETQFRSFDVEGILNSSAFWEGRYQDVNAVKYLGASGGFSIIDEDGNTVYSSTSAMPVIRSRDTLLCIPEYNADTYLESVSLRTTDGEQRLIITQETYSGSELIQTTAVVLDHNGRVLEGELHPGKKSYTQEEIQYLTGTWSDGFSLERYVTEDKNGSVITVLFLLPNYYSEAYFQKAVSASDRIWLLMIPAYLVITLAFITMLNRHFRLPLERLNHAIVRLGLGEKATVTECGGPKEIQEIGRSFDEMAYKLAKSEAETRRLEQERLKMLTDISHDLKTPLTVISGYTNAIRDGKVPQNEVPQYMETISSKVDSLTNLINNFYEYSKTEHPDFRLECTDTDLCEFLREYLAGKYDEIELAGFTLNVDIPETVSICKIDTFQLSRAFDNILNNSIKHNRLGTIIHIVLMENADSLILRIADNGEGISEIGRKDLFTPFAVGDQSRSKGGSGLGLAITKKIINAHGWNIRLVDTHNVGGTVFEIEIPK